MKYYFVGTSCFHSRRVPQIPKDTPRCHARGSEGHGRSGELLSCYCHTGVCWSQRKQDEGGLPSVINFPLLEYRPALRDQHPLVMLLSLKNTWFTFRMLLWQLTLTTAHLPLCTRVFTESIRRTWNNERTLTTSEICIYLYLNIDSLLAPT